MKNWVIAAILVISGANVFTACTGDTGDNPVNPDEYIVTLEDALKDGTIVAFTFSLLKIKTGFPQIVISTVRSGILADVAPSVLHIMGLQQPKEMTGQCLINE